MAIPITQAEVKELLKHTQNQDEEKIISCLANNIEEKSVASKIYKEWGLTRSVIKECHTAMSKDRSLQTVFNNLVGATRFKVIEKNRLLPASCPKKGCGKRDSWEHFIICYEPPDIGQMKDKEKIKAIIALCKIIRTENPTRPIPYENEV